MSTIRANNYYDASGGSNAQLYGVASPPNSMGFRNRIINGDMRIDQRNAGASVNIGAGTFIVDRFKGFRSGGAATITGQQSTTAPIGFSNSVVLTVGTGAAPGATDYTQFDQNIEGFNTADLAWGTAGAQSVTLSFWVRSSLTGTFGVAFRNSAGNRSYVASYTISAANTFEYKTIVIAGDTTGTWLTDNNSGIKMTFDMGVGSTYSNTAGTWAGANYFGLTGGVKLAATAGATWYITGVQLEAGTVASAFERRDYGRELIMCQRYYQNIGGQTLTGFAETSSSLAVTVFFYQQMRAAPTCSIRSGTLSVRSPGGDYNATSPALANTTGGTNAIWTNISGFSGLTTNAVVTSRLTNTDVIAASAEL